MTDQTYNRAACGKSLAVLSLFFGLTVAAHATNTVTGLAYGTNYAALATAGSIASLADEDGTLVVGYEGTTNLTLSHRISGYIAVTNKTAGFTVDAAGATITGSRGTAAIFMALAATNLTVSGGRFIAGGDPPDSEGGPPIPVIDSAGGWITNGSITVSGSEFAGTNYTAGFIVQQSDFTASNSVFRGGAYGSGLYVTDDSTLTIHGGSFTGGVENTAVWLQDSDAAIYDGTFIGNIDGPTNVAGTGLYSELTEASTNSVSLHGGTFSGLAFYGVDSSVQQFLAGTNLVVEGSIVQNGGTVIVDNQDDSALTDIVILSGTMSFPSNTFTLLDGGTFYLDGTDSMASFNRLNLSANATMDIGTAMISANEFYAGSFSSNLLTITDTTNGSIKTGTAWFDTDSVLVVDASDAGMSSSETNDFALISADTNQLFAGASTNSAATAQDFKDNVDVETATSDRAQFIDLYFDTVNGETVVKFQFTAQSLSDYWNLTNGTSTGVTEEFANELDQLASSEMLTLIDGYGDPDASLAAIEETYFTRMNTFQTVLHGIEAAVGQSASRGAEFREQTQLRPSGARGPEHGSNMRGWAKYYGQRFSHDPVDLNSAYETSLDGGVIGVDMSFGSFLAGVAGGYGSYLTESGPSSAEEEITAYHGSVYGTMGMEKAYIDAGIAYGFNEVESRTMSPFVLNGEFDAQILSAYLAGGIDLVDSTEGMIFTPEASVQYSMYEQDDYSETSTVALARRFDSFESDSLRTSVGLNVSVQDPVKMETFSFKYDLRLHWMREFNPDPGSMSFSLDGGDNGYQLAYPMLDEDIYRAGIGAVFSNSKRNQPRNVLFRIDFDELFGDGFNSHNFSAKVIYAF